MAFVADEDSPKALFSTHVWVDDYDDDGINNSYSTEREAVEAFELLEKGGSFAFGAVYRWNSGTNDWICLDAWPEDFDGFGEE